MPNQNREQFRDTKDNLLATLSIHSFTVLAILCRVLENAECILGDSGHKVGDILAELSLGQFKDANQYMSLDLGRKPEKAQ